jgi:hypothetical protein
MVIFGGFGGLLVLWSMLENWGFFGELANDWRIGEFLVFTR